MVTIKDGCGCDPCDCDWKQKLKEAYSRAIQSVNKIGDNDGSVYFPDGTGFVKLPLPRQSDVAQIKTNAQDIANLKVQDVQLQANITAETTAREEAIAAEASAREAGIAAEASARETAITAETTAREEAIAAEASAREAKDTELDADIARIDNTDAGQDQRIQDNADRITSTYNDLVSTEATVATHDSEIITLQAQTQSLSKSIVSDVMMTDGTTAGSVQVSIEKEDGALITSANYKWGKDIGVRLEAGTQAGYIKTVISLSDGTELESNEYKIVEVLESDVYVTAITLVPDMTAGTIGGNISYSNGTTQTINSVSVPTAPGVTSAIEALQTRMAAAEQKNTTQDSQISAIDGRVQALENVPVIEQFAAGKLGTIAGSSIDGRVKAENDGTGSVNGWSNLKSRVSTAESQIVSAQNDISALDGTVSQQTTDISDLKSRVSTAESQIVTAQNGISALDGRVAQQTTDISGMKTDITNLKNKNTQQDQSIAANTSAISANTSAIAGKVAINQGTGNAGKALVVGSDGNVTTGVISGGGEVWEEVDLSNWPTNWVEGDKVKIIFKNYMKKVTATDWNTVPTLGNFEIYGNAFHGIIETIINSNGSPYYDYIAKYNNSISIMTIKLQPASNLNQGQICYLDQITFNGGGIVTSYSNKISNVNSVIYKMWRLKK